VILSLDTTSEFGSIALTGREGLIEEAAVHAPEGFGHILYGHLERLLARHGVDICGIECYAAASGPGSFTGVRVGLAAVKGLAASWGRPVVAVSNLQALAWFGTAGWRAPLIDARRGEIYGAVYDSDLELAGQEVVMPFQDWLRALPASDVEIISTDIAPFRAFSDPRIPVIEAPRALAAAVGRIAWARYEKGEAAGAAEADANYVRRSDAELFWKG